MFFGVKTNTFSLSMKFTGTDSTNFKSYGAYTWTISSAKVYCAKKSNANFGRLSAGAQPSIWLCLLFPFFTLWYICV